MLWRRKSKVKIVLTCLRCGSKWIKRGKRTPKRCRWCTSPYWNREYIPTFILPDIKEGEEVVYTPEYERRVTYHMKKNPFLKKKKRADGLIVIYWPKY